MLPQDLYERVTKSIPIVMYQETIEMALKRHLLHDLNVKHFKFLAGNSANRPFFVQEYAHVQSSATAGFDPSKQSIGLTYLIVVEDQPKPRNEASDFLWLEEDKIPNQAAYNQQILFKEAFKFIKRHSIQHTSIST
jgi:hypothetical protein